jgi:hypothetical protein
MGTTSVRTRDFAPRPLNQFSPPDSVPLRAVVMAHVTHALQGLFRSHMDGRRV